MYRGSQFQRGQALIYGIFVLMGGLTALFFLFNTGQLSSEKTKLVNTADAVAYSAGVMQARALNFDAYSNRALVANEVLVAQMVSLSSWGQYVSRHANNLIPQFLECQNPFSAVSAAVFNYDPLYGIFCYAASFFGTDIIDLAGQDVTRVSAAAISPIEASKRAILSSQALLHAPAYLQNASMRVMQEVADRNYAGDGAVTVAAFAGEPSATTAGATDVLNGFTTQYSGAARVRFAEVAKLAAYSDEFVRERNWTSEALAPPPKEWKCVGKNLKNSVKRRGGTELINLDEWKAEDTESFWRVTNAGGINLDCNIREHVIGYGEQQAHPSDKDQDESGARLGGSPATNPRASRAASSSEWTAYTGLPSFYDISALDPAVGDPVMQFRVRLTRNAANTRTSAGTSTIASTPRLNNFQNNFADGVMTAVAGGEVYFERPLTVPNDLTQGNYNQYAEKIGSHEKREIGSLFNPYWQVRLQQSTP
ncbi:pilus assembly protein TadG-related protein [Actimicrobium sp. CCC2.4]|uniref:pilus assembly protein TadG-related protein n=1 Tax=Actimicrobium sp. CCC2.4 TaxID=3048606 RepID=UPI002AC8D112|nr:pilus assembly protein TadG-related protein [Actimicrobium sp. CCC2.4]MEB0135212.1 pilus assembly protein TadG-related protein [Actimicrobium sp. CCC2.4]WPX31008.1 pilus assembly protein TadG-related protein [Actimicrobium sp. CCC2.4]